MNADDALVALCLAGLVGLGAWTLHRLAPRSGLLGRKRELADWEHRLEELLQDHARTCLHAAALEFELAELIEQMPATFVHPVLRGVRLGHAIEQALMVKAVALGIHPNPLPAADAPADLAGSPPGASAGLTWHDGRLVPRRAP